MKKRLVSLFLSFVLLLTLFPASTVAATAGTSGTCGDNLTWSLDESGTLTIEGTGAMADYDWQSPAPWSDFSDEITSLYIGSGVTSIGDFAFDDFSTLTDVTIPEGVTSIGSYAFSDRNRLTSISVPASVTSIGTSAFLLCGCINVDSANSHYSSDSDGVLYNKDKTTLIHFPNLETEYSTFEEIQSHSISYAIPDGVEHIEESAFWNNPFLTSITIPDSVTSIGDWAFWGCYSLTSATFEGDAPTDFGSGVFNSCAPNFAIHAPAGNTTWTSTEAYDAAAKTWNGYQILFGDEPQISIIASGYCGGNNEWEYDLNSSSYKNLTWRLDEDGVLTISGEGAMMDYQYDTGGGFASPSDFVYVVESPWKQYRDRITSVVLEDGVTSIGDNAFRECNNMTSAILPDGVTSIGDYAFCNCTSLTVTIPASVTSIGNYAFLGCYRVYEPATVYVTIVTNDGIQLTAEPISTTAGSTIEDVLKYAHRLYCPQGEAGFSAGIDPTYYVYWISKCWGVTASPYVFLNSTPLATDENFCVSAANTAEVQDGDDILVVVDAIFALPIVSIRFAPDDDGVRLTARSWWLDINTFAYVSVPYADAEIYDGNGVLIGRTGEDGTLTVAADVQTAVIPGICAAHIRPEGPAARTVASGTCGAEGDGTNLTWKLDGKGTLTISGEGAMREMYDLFGFIIAPSWAAYASEIKTVVIEEGVTSICASAFSGCGSLTSVTIPDSVTSIGDSAFMFCTSLTSVTIPDSVTSIGNNAFVFCFGITSIEIPEGVTSIGAGAFMLCGFASVNLPASLAFLGDGAFESCPITAFSVNAGNANYCAVDGILYTKDMTTLIAYPAAALANSFEIPDTVNRIAPYAFSMNFNLSSITIPDSVTTICDYAFTSCFALSDITVPAGVSEIGAGAFSGCSNLNAIGLDADNQNFCTVDGVLYSEDMATLLAYPAGKTDTVFTVPSGVAAIGAGAFSGTVLTEITIPNSVTAIGSGTFNNCINLTEITVPEGVTSIGFGVFDGCASLTDIYFNGTEEQWNRLIASYFGFDSSWRNAVVHFSKTGFCGGDTTAEYDEASGSYKNLTWTLDSSGTLTISGEGAMYDSFFGIIPAPWSAYASEIKTVVIKEGVTSICASAFSGCGSLTSVTIPDSVTSIGASAFLFCSNLKSIEIPEGVTSIGASAFALCGLTSVSLPAGLTSLGDGAFEVCPISAFNVNAENADYCAVDGVLYSKDMTMLVAYPAAASAKSFVIPDTVNRIAPYTFCGNFILNSVTIPNSVSTIGDYAFNACSFLTDITVPAGVSEIGAGAFSGCSNLNAIGLDADNQNFCTVDGVLYSEDMATLLAYPAGKTDTVFTVPNGVAAIGGGAFYGATLTEITLPNSVTTIGNGAFSGCFNLTEITIPAGVELIDGSAFSNSVALRRITLPASITSIGFGVFDGCASLTDIYFNGTEEQWNRLIAFYFGFDSSLQNATVHFGGTPTDVYSGTCGAQGDNLTWTLDEDGLLTISGTGAMMNFDYVSGGGYASPSDFVYVVESPWKQYRDRITSVVLNDGVTSIGDNAFRECYYLTSVTIPNSVTSIGTSTFSDCDNLTSVTIPDGVTSIGNCAFFDCGNLTSVTISDSVTSLGYGAFEYCGNLATLTIGSRVVSIGEWAFNGCGSLTNVTIPDSVTFIGTSAFNNCTNLTSITIPTNVTSVGDTVFYRCTSLTSGIFRGDAPTDFGYSVFNSCADDFTIYARYGNTTWTSGEAYDADAQTWNGYPIRFYGEPPHEHNYQDTTVPPTCTEQGYTVHTCECGVSYRDSFTNATGHQWGDGVDRIAPTTGTAGTRVYTCTVCQAERTETVPALGHSFIESETVAPTCTAQGYTLYVCTTCQAEGKSHTYVGDFVTATGHDYKPTIVKPTCTQKGYTLYVCKHCGSSYISDYVPASGHSWDAGTVTLEATADADGIRTFTCLICGITRTEGIPALGHTFTKEIVLPTCVAKGYTRYTCTTCAEHSYMSDYTDAHGHHFTEKVVPPTCTSRGYTVYTCADCRLVQTGAYVDKLQHSYQITDVQNATAEAGGYTEYTCRNCGDSFTVEIPALGHEFTSVVTPPTCTEQGYTTYFCETCEDGEHSYEDCFVPAKGHSWKPDNTVGADCTHGGYTVYVCETCRAQMIADQTPMTEHDYNSGGICKICHAHDPKKHPNSPEHKKAEDMSGMSEELAAAFSDDVDALLAEMTEQVALLNNGERPDASELYEFTLTAEIDGEKTTVMANDFPEEGVEVIIPYPAGTDKNTKFNIVHMFSNSYGGHLAGEMECPAFSPEDDGIHMILTSLSPVFLSWEDEWEAVLEPTVEVDRNAGSVTVTPSYFSAAYCIASVYSEAGQLISSKTASVTEPDQPLTLSGLTGYTVKVFLLDQNYRPVCSSIIR